MRKRLAFLLIALCGTSCGSPERARLPRHSTRLSATAVDGGQVVRRLESDAHTLNAVLQTTEYERYVLSYIHDPLVDLDANLQPIAGTAASWEIAEGGRSYTFHVDPRATFSDGAPVRASDVLFTVSRIVDEQSMQYAANFEGFDRSRSAAIDDRTVRISFREPRVGQLLAFNIAVLPEHVYAKGDFQRDFNDSAVGDGPYTLASWEHGRSILLRRRDNYWRSKPKIASVLFKVLSDDNVAWLAMKQGQIDDMRVKSDRWAAEKDSAAARDTLAFYDLYLLSYDCVAWNNRDPLFSDARVRRALAVAYDRDSIIRDLYRGQARAITGPFSPDQWAYDTTVPPIRFDLSQASDLMKQAGWSDSDGDGVRDRRGRRFTFDMLVPAGSHVAMEQTQTYQEALRKIGVSMNIRPLDGATMFQQLNGGRYQAAFMGLSVDADPDVYALFHSKQFPPNGLNFVYYSSPEADALIEQSRREFDPGRRRQLFHRLHALLARDQPYLWTVQVATKWAVNKRVRGVAVSKGFGIDNWYPGPRSWWISR